VTTGYRLFRELENMAEPDEELKVELAALRREVARLNSHRFIRIQNSIPKMLLFQFGRGLALGLGTVIGASVLVSIVAYFLSQINFVPLIGEWAAEIAESILREIEAGSQGGR
jgi:hypothetical protein